MKFWRQTTKDTTICAYISFTEPGSKCLHIALAKVIDLYKFLKSLYRAMTLCYQNFLALLSVISLYDKFDGMHLTQKHRYYPELVSK